MLQLIKQVIETCKKTKTDVTVCGEMAGEKFILSFSGLGLTSFSMHPQAIPEIKNLIRQTHAKALEQKLMQS